MSEMKESERERRERERERVGNQSRCKERLT